MRRGLTLTKREKRQIEKAIAKLDQAYQRGKINPMVYRSQRGELLANLNRPMASRTPINLNQKGYFNKRKDVHFGPSPVGYFQDGSRRTIYDTRNGIFTTPYGGPSNKPKVSDNKIRAALINIAENGYWNSDSFQEAIQTASKASQEARNNNASFFQQAVMKSEALGSAMNTLSEAGVWEEIQNSEPVVRALQRLEDTINYTTRRMYAVGISKEEARDAIKRAAIKSGKSMTASGFSKERAAEIIAMVIRGEIGTTKAVAEIAGELNKAAQNIAALNQNDSAVNQAPTATPPTDDDFANENFNMNFNMNFNQGFTPAWNNGFDIYGNGTPTGVSSQALKQAKNMLEQQFDLSNNPVERNELSQRISQIEQTLNQREQGVESLRRSFKPSNNSTQGPVEATYNPRNNFRAANSLMQQTAAALNRGGPSITTVVKDLFTIDANMYLDWTSGTPIEIANDGSFANAGSNSDPSRVFPSGVWTVFAANANAIPTLKSIINSIGYALASPLWSDGDRAYLTYLKNITEQRILAMESAPSVNNAVNNPVNNPMNNAVNNPVNNPMNNAVNNPVNNPMNNAVNNPVNNAAIQQEFQTLTVNNSAEEALRLAIQQAERKAAQQAQRQAAQQAKAAQQAERKAAQQEQRRIKQAEQAERRALQQMERRAAQQAKAAQQAERRAAQQAKAAQQAQRKAAQQAERRAAQAARRSGFGPISTPGRGFPGGPSLGPRGGSGFLRGSTSTTTSTRSHGGARFVNDPRAVYRN